MKLEKSVQKEFWFEMAHRLKSVHGSFYPKEKCGSLHGHSVRVTVVAALKENQDLNEYGFVMDFADFKPLKKWIQTHLDHATIVGSNDKDLLEFLKLQGDRYFQVPEGTASSEMLGTIIMREAQRLLETERVRISEVRLSETCTSEAIVKS